VDPYEKGPNIDTGAVAGGVTKDDETGVADQNAGGGAVKGGPKLKRGLSAGFD